MTVPVREPSGPGDIAALAWRTQQLARRPPAATDESVRFQMKIVHDEDTVTTGDGQLIFLVEDDMANLSLVACYAYVTTVSSSGLVTVQIRNVTDAVDMLSTPITIDVSEFSSYFAATPPVINTANDQVDTGDRIAIDVDGAGTGAKGLGVIVKFGIPTG